MTGTSAVRPSVAALVTALVTTLAATLVATVVPWVTTTSPARADTSWLCLPSRAADDCRGDLTTTMQRRDGSSTVTHPRRVRHPGVDCFYVYPTSSQQVTPNSDGSKEASVSAVTRQQAQRFSSLCRVYAPLYRQRTLVALSAEAAFSRAQKASFYRTAYADVLAAWKDYLAHHNHGRGFVLLGHSQGSRLLRKLVREEIDRRPAVRSRMVSAVLPGADVVVRRGSDRGGDFAHVRVCHRASQLHCVMAWSTFNATPPDDSRFGRPPLTDVGSPGLALPVGRDLRVVCTNPASLARNRRAPTHAATRSEMLPGLLGVLAIGLYGGPPPSADTPWLVPTDRYTSRCATVNGARVLLLQPIGSVTELHPQPNDTWGLHLLDVNIVLRDLIRIVRTQVHHYERR